MMSALGDALDLWHPSGHATPRMTLGSQAGETTYVSGRCGLAVVAPGRAETGVDWLERAIAQAAGRLDHDGVLWLFVEPRARRSAPRLLRRAGLRVAGAVLAVPPWPAPSHLIPVEGRVLAHAAANHLTLRPNAVRSLDLAARSPGGRHVLMRAAPACGLLASRDARPLAWLGPGTSATVHAGMRGDARVSVVMRYPARSKRPDIALKVAWDAAGARRVDAERAALGAVGRAAARAGAAVPELRDPVGPSRSALTALEGERADVALRNRPEQLATVAGAVARWLASWHAATVVREPLDSSRLDVLLRAPLDVVAPALDEAGLAYRARLEALAARLEGSTFPFVAAHNDLTMANLLIQAGRLGIIDWESATDRGLPTADLWYALCDGLARSEGVSHAEAVLELRRGAASPARELGEWLRGLGAELSLSEDARALAFHAGWLQHARNEIERERPGPFLGVVRAVARA